MKSPCGCKTCIVLRSVTVKTWQKHSKNPANMQQKLSKTPAKKQQKPSKNTAKRTVFRCFYACEGSPMHGAENLKRRKWRRRGKEEEEKEKGGESVENLVRGDSFKAKAEAKPKQSKIHKTRRQAGGLRFVIVDNTYYTQIVNCAMILFQCVSYSACRRNLWSVWTAKAAGFTFPGQVASHGKERKRA